MTRRLTLLIGLGCAVAVADLAAQGLQARWEGAAATPTDTLSAPPILPNRSAVPGVVEVSLTAAPARLSLLPGAATDVYAYNGRIPGPTLELREGDRVIIHFRNELPEPTQSPRQDARLRGFPSRCASLRRRTRTWWPEFARTGSTEAPRPWVTSVRLRGAQHWATRWVASRGAGYGANEHGQVRGL